VIIGWFRTREGSRDRRRTAARAAGLRSGFARSLSTGPEQLESRAMMAAAQLSTIEVNALLDRASAATPSTDAIIAVVDVRGTILGVRTEAGVSVAPADLGFAIDGAVAKARTGAFFSNNQAILTSRTVSHISQSTVTQREMQANPASADPTKQGPGYVAPVSVGGEFPPGILRQPLVDLFAIEHTNRVTVVTGMGGSTVVKRDAYAQQIAAPGITTNAVARGIATLPGGLGIYRFGTNEVIGGIGVFFPGSDGTASFEQNFVPTAAQSRADRLNAPKALEAEAIALVSLLPVAVRTSGGAVLPPLGVTLSPIEAINRAGGLGGALPLSLAQAQGLVNRINAAARINLGGIALQTFGPQAGPLGVQTLFNIINAAAGRGAVSGVLQPVIFGGGLLLPGQVQPDGWLVPATGSSFAGGLTAAQVTQLVNQGVWQSMKTRAQIRLQPTSAKMVLAVADRDGRLLGVYRMPGATVFSIDVAIAKSRNTAYYASDDLQTPDRTPGVPKYAAFTNRTFRYLAVPKYPSGNSTAPPGPFSILNTPGINPTSGLNVGPPKPASAFNGTVLGYDSFHPGTNFRATTPAANQNGVVFFPGSTAVYTAARLQGGYGISGDGVDQDDIVTFFGSTGFAAPTYAQAGQFFVSGIRLPYIKFSRTAQIGV